MKQWCFPNEDTTMTMFDICVPSGKCVSMELNMIELQTVIDSLEKAKKTFDLES